MKYSNEVYIGALQALAALRSKVSDKKKATIDFIAEAIAEKGDRDRGNRPEPTEALTCQGCMYFEDDYELEPCDACKRLVRVNDYYRRKPEEEHYNGE